MKIKGYELILASLMVLISLVSKADNYVNERESHTHKKTSSGTRGCRTALPKITLEVNPLEKPELIVEKETFNRDSQYPLTLSLSDVEAMETLWVVETVLVQEKQVFYPSLSLKEERRYRAVASIPCEGDHSAGAVVNLLFQVGSEVEK